MIYWILLQKFLGIYWTYIIMVTLRRGWIIVRVGIMIVCCIYFCLQYQVLFSCMEQIYCTLTTNSTAKITCPSIILLFHSLYAYDINWIPYNPFSVVSSVFMAPQIPDETNESLCSLNPSRTTWCISSNALKGVDFGVSSMILKLLYNPRTGQ